MQNLLNTSLAPIYPSLHVLYALSLLYISEASAKIHENTVLGRCLVWAIKQTFCFSVYGFPVG